MYRVVPACGRAENIAFVQSVALYGCKPWCDLKEGSRWEDLQLLLNFQSKSTLGMLTTTPKGALMPQSALSQAAVAFDAGQYRV